MISAKESETKKFKERFPAIADGHFRNAQGLWLSSIGIGTYLGNWDDEKDNDYIEAITRYVSLGGNVIDTAANYRYQRSERSIGKALAILKERGFSREELLICTKAGFLAFDGGPEKDSRAFFEANFISKGIAGPDDLAGGSHCMAPKYLDHQINQSLKNMGIEAIDVFYIHNPESQLSSLDKYTFEARLAKAFEQLEKNRAEGKIKFYGIASWNGFRAAPDNPSYHSLERMLNIARQIGGEGNGLKFIQLPFNISMPEALLLQNQSYEGKAYSCIEAAHSMGISIMASASILQGKLSRGLPSGLRVNLGSLESDAQSSLQFVRSTPGITSALVGMSSKFHVEENMALARIEPLSDDKYQRLFASDQD